MHLYLFLKLNYYETFKGLFNDLLTQITRHLDLVGNTVTLSAEGRRIESSVG